MNGAWAAGYRSPSLARAFRYTPEEGANALGSNRISLVGSMLSGLGLPTLLAGATDLPAPTEAFAELAFAHSLAILAGAIGMGHLILRHLCALPMARAGWLVLPSLALAFSLVGAIVVFTDSTTSTLAVGEVAACAALWYLAVIVLRRKRKPVRLGFIGERPVDAAVIAEAQEWIDASEIHLPRPINGIVVDGQFRLSEAQESMLNRAVVRDIPVYDLQQLRERLTGRVSIEASPHDAFGTVPVLRPYLRIKRFLDIAIALPALCLALPVMLVFGALIRLESPGPALFRQVRMGYRGRKFVCYKLRSMRSEQIGPAYTQDQDPRITRIGRVIRKWRIDELPQLLNVLRGDMSIIGPRPEAIQLARLYQRDIAYYGYRHTLRPGITGWAAVNQGNVALQQAARVKLEYDFFYVKHASLWLDLWILVLTVRTIVSGFGAK